MDRVFAGPPLLEALNAGSIDLGHTGDSPPIFAQAADVPFRYFAVSSPSPKVPRCSYIETQTFIPARISKARRIGYTKGTSAHTMEAQVLGKDWAEAGLTFNQRISPTSRRSHRYRVGSIDAWSIWDPYLAGAEKEGNVRTLLAALVLSMDANTIYVPKISHKTSRELLSVFEQELTSVKKWAQAHVEDVNAFLCEESGLPIEVVTLVESRRNRYDTLPLGPDVIAGQQDLANRYWQLGLIPKQIDIEQALLKPSLNGS